MPERRVEGLITRLDGQKAFGEFFIRSISDLSQIIPDMKLRHGKKLKPCTPEKLGPVQQGRFSA